MLATCHVEVSKPLPGRIVLRNLTVIIPAAGLGRRLRQGPKALLDLEGQTLLARQIVVLRRVFPQADIVVTVGHEADTVARSLPSGVRTVENERYAETNVARSLELALRASRSNNVLIVYGDLVFDTSVFRDFPGEGRESLLLAHSGQRPYEVGVTSVAGFATAFSYGLELKWAQMLFLRGWELQQFRKLLAEPHRRRYFGFEVLNDLVEQGGRLRVLATPPTAPLRLIEVDTPADLTAARRFVSSSR